MGDDKGPDVLAFWKLTICLEFGQAKFKVVLEADFRNVSSYLDLMFPMAHSPLYVKALPLQELDDVETIKTEIRTGNILIVRITPLARKSVDETKLAITELTDHVKSIGGDIARLGEERIVITPPGVKIWRRETASSETAIPAVSVQKETLPGSN